MSSVGRAAESFSGSLSSISRSVSGYASNLFGSGSSSGGRSQGNASGSSTSLSSQARDFLSQYEEPRIIGYQYVDPQGIIDGGFDIFMSSRQSEPVFENKNPLFSPLLFTRPQTQAQTQAQAPAPISTNQQRLEETAQWFEKRGNTTMAAQVRAHAQGKRNESRGNAYNHQEQQQRLRQIEAFSETPLAKVTGPIGRGAFNSASFVTENPRVVGEIGASIFVPGAGEAMDGMVLRDPNASTFDKSLATFSLGVSAFTFGFSPNAGAFLRNADEVIDVGRFDNGISRLGTSNRGSGLVTGTPSGNVVSRKARVSELHGRQLKSEFTGSKIKRLKKDMKANGFNQNFPIEITEIYGRKIIIDGHHRARAAGAAGIKEVPIIFKQVTPKQADLLMQQAAEAAENLGQPF